MIEKLYTVEEVAELASVTGRTIRNYLKSGRLVGRKIGGQWRFAESEVQRLLTGGEPVFPSSSTIEEEPLIPEPQQEEKIPLIPSQDMQSQNFEPSVEHPNTYFRNPIEHETISEEVYYETPSLPISEHSIQETLYYAAKPAPLPVNSPPIRQASIAESVPPIQKYTSSTPIYPTQNPNDMPPAGTYQQQKGNYHPSLPNLDFSTPINNPQYNASFHESQSVSSYQEAPTNVYPPIIPSLQSQPIHQYDAPVQPAYTYPTQSPPSYQNQPPQTIPAPIMAPPSYNEQSPTAPPPLPTYYTAPVEASSVVEPIVEVPTQKKAQQDVEPEEKQTRVPAMPELSDVGKQVTRFVAEVHDCSHGPQICSIVDLHQTLAAAKATSERLSEIARQESENGQLCQSFVEFDERYFVARYTLFGTSSFLSRCLQLLG